MIESGQHPPDSGATLPSVRPDFAEFGGRRAEIMKILPGFEDMWGNLAGSCPAARPAESGLASTARRGSVHSAQVVHVSGVGVPAELRAATTSVNLRQP